MLRYIIQSGLRALPGTVALWVNKWIALFANSPRIALRDWRPDADNTAAAFGTGVVIVLALGVPLIPSRLARFGLALLLLILSAIAMWQCYESFDMLSSIPMSTTDARRPQAVWEYWYIGMLVAFVAAVTSALALLRGGNPRNGDQAEDLAGENAGTGNE
jgi:hypothetical protein